MGDAPNKESVSDIEMVNECVIDPAIRNVSDSFVINQQRGGSAKDKSNEYVIRVVIINISDSCGIYQTKRVFLVYIYKVNENVLYPAIRNVSDLFVIYQTKRVSLI